MLKPHTRTIAIAAFAALAVGIAATPSQAGGGFLDRVKQRARDGAATVRQRTQETRARVTQSVERAQDRARDTRSRVTETIERTRERGREVRERARDAGERVRESAARAGTATTRAAERCVETIAIPEKRKEFVDRAAPIARELAVAGIKHVPIYDPDTGNVVTFDRYMRTTLSDMGGGAMLGSDLADDPVRTGLLLMIDSNSLDTLRIIQDPGNGEWISIDEAMGRTSVSRSHVTRVRRATESCRTAYSSGDANATRRAVVELEQALAAAPTSSSDASLDRLASLADSEALQVADGAFQGLQRMLHHDAELDRGDAKNAALALLALLAAFPPFVLGRLSKRRRITVVAPTTPRSRTRRRV